MEFEEKLRELSIKVTNILVEKNKKYGNSFYEGLDELKEIYTKNKLGKTLHYFSFYVREKDKLNRLKNLIDSDIEQKDKKSAIFDAVLDIVGYGLLFLNYIQNEKNMEENGDISKWIREKEKLIKQ